jgi:hypothetical protein
MSGLVAAVAHRRAELASWPPPTAGDSRAGPADARAHVNILECAATYVREGALDAGGLSVLRATIAELEAALRPGFSSLNQKRLWMLRMAELVEFAATASAGEPSRESRS